MPDIIRLLPDSVANQIAAGEVIQRPASAVKELMENSIDAGATKIQLIVKDAGRTLLQIVDNGKGMSETDARISFERHATSKIRNAGDLFDLHTMGFRGEALASIAAVAQVEMKTRREEDSSGTEIRMEGSKFISQEDCAVPAGTSFSVKNLFYNVPARRNFLKSEAVEFRHIVEEFERIAFAHPGTAFSLHHNNSELFNLLPGHGDFRAQLRQRIVALYGNPYNQRLVPVEESTPILSVSGFIGKPEFAKRSRGEQFFFLNKRFIRNSYLHHAVQSAFEQLLPKDAFACYFLFLEVDPKSIDVNIHPTKTEVKFEDERSVYAILRSAVKRALGQYNISPTLDFEQEMSMQVPAKNNAALVAPTIKVNPGYNPFAEQKKFSGENPLPVPGKFSGDWQQMFDQRIAKNEPGQKILHSEMDAPVEHPSSSQIWQLHERYILTPIRSGILVIDQQRAHERVLYERFLRAMKNANSSSQRLLFPETMEIPAADAVLISGLLGEINSCGFDVQHFGANTFVVNGIPAGLEEKSAALVLEKMIGEFRENEQELRLHPQESIARSLAKQAAVKQGRILSPEEMRALADELFACETPAYAPDGKPAFINFPIEEIDKRFKR
ncbi:MAG: DNA mismatch repair endonuclease MutL [Bacteroidetes bacterium]|nr:DNA mismatch repair endonuclease MutL [Bacteroidota bacterium]